MNLIYSKTRVYDEETGEMLPWLNKSALEELSYFVIQDWDVFEYGSGYSTLWWAKRVKSIFSVEHNLSFFNIMEKELKKENCYYWHRQRKPKRQPSAYSNAIIETQKEFDCIIVDGRDRVLCIQTAIDKLKKGGIFILDNSERKKYKSGIDLLNKKFDLYYKSPIDKTKGQSPYIWETSIWMNV
jgi:predicted O-methyltransferase YrrM